MKSITFTSHLTPFRKQNGEFITGNEGKLVLFDAMTFADLSYGLKPENTENYIKSLGEKEAGTRVVQLSHLDPRVWERWDDWINGLRHNNYDNVYQAFVRNGLISRPSDVNKATLRISYNVRQVVKNRIEKGHYALTGDRMTDLKTPITLAGARGETFAHFIFDYGSMSWLIDMLTSEWQELGTELMINVMRERELSIINGITDRYYGIKPPASGAAEIKRHGTIEMEADDAALGTFALNQWSTGVLTSAKKVVNAAIRYMRRKTTDGGQDAKGSRYILLLGSDLYQYMGEDVLDGADRIETTLMARLGQIPQIAEIVEACELDGASFALIGIDPRRNSFIDVIPMTTSVDQAALAGSERQVVIYMLNSMKVIATAEFKKVNILVNNA